MLKELVHDKIDEIFLTYQQANNIISGDIEPFDALQLEQIEESLCELIERVGKYQPKGYSAYYTYLTDTKTTYTKEFALVGVDEFFREVSNVIAFGDLTNYDVTSIHYNGKKIEYVGWQPNMIFEYKDTDGNTVWVGQFKEWDH